jgi:N-glycosylase/DNA lyase
MDERKSLNLKIKDLKKVYREKKKEIKKRLDDFKKIWSDGTDKEIFSELAFCICAFQNKAEYSDEAVRLLRSNGILLHGSSRKIANILRSRVRFHNQKSRYIVESREYFSENGHLRIKGVLNRLLNTEKPYNQPLRDWLAENPKVKGLGFKEASHFLRNIGFGDDLAILDRHIMKNLVKYKAIPEIPSSLTRKRYLEIEEKMRRFSLRVNIPMVDLDLLFWSNETGRIYK